MIDTRSVSIELVGLANNNPYLQQHLGRVCVPFDSTDGAPILWDGSTRYTLDVHRAPNSDITVTVEGWAHGQGLMIFLREHNYTFTTGLASYQSGMSGTLSHGGNELVALLQQIRGD